MKRAAPAVLALAIAAAYSGTFSDPFVLDDAANIGAASGAGLTVAGRPILRLSLDLNRAISGSQVWSYHAINLAIHVAAALVLLEIVRRTANDTLALFAALLWALHPLQTEAVTYISQRAESLMGLFYLLTLYTFIRAVSASPGIRRGWALASCAACALGMATKEVMVTAPLLVLLYDSIFVSGGFRRALRRHFWIYAGLAAGWLLLAALEMPLHGRGGTVGFATGLPWQAYAITQIHAIALYLGLFVWPHGLVFDYGQPICNSVRQVLPELFLLLILAGAAGIAMARRTWRPLGFLGAAFFLILLPSSSVIPIATQTIAEHRVYLALAPLAVLSVWVLLRMLPRPVIPLTLGLTALAAITYARNYVYRSGLSLWTDTVAKCPGNPRAHYNLGVELGKVPGRTAEAIDQYNQTLEIDPEYLDAHYNLATELAKFPNRRSESIAHYAAALQIDPGRADAHYNLAIELAEIPGREDEAILHFREAIRLKPAFVEAHVNLARLYAQTGRQEETRRELEAVYRLRPDWPGVREALERLSSQGP
jgi:tetratricopeptide (TPR) repeat protein